MNTTKSSMERNWPEPVLVQIKKAMVLVSTHADTSRLKAHSHQACLRLSMDVDTLGVNA